MCDLRSAQNATSTYFLTMASRLTLTAMNKMWTLYVIAILLTFATVSTAFVLIPQSKWSANAHYQTNTRRAPTTSFGLVSNTGAEAEAEAAPTRRAFVATATLLATGALFSIVAPAYAVGGMAMITAEEFDIILRDSARSIIRVEFSGPRSDTIIVKLVDGTQFGIKDVIESPFDPRSPLKIAAVCRENRVPTKFVDLEEMLASSSVSKKKKMYTNERVAAAAEKNKEKAARMQQDEEDRLAALYKLEQKQ
jgi:hypothetical protein